MRADAFESFADVGVDPLLNQLPANPVIQRRRVRKIDIEVAFADRLTGENYPYRISRVDDQAAGARRQRAGSERAESPSDFCDHVGILPQNRLLYWLPEGHQ